MSRVLPFALLFAASCVAADEPVAAIVARGDGSGVIAPVAMRRAVDKEGRELPGTLVFDTEDGRLDLTALVPSEPRTFEDVKQFHAWAIEALGARLDERDRVPVVALEYTAPTTLRYDRERDDLVTVDDPVAAIIGGTEGYVVIGGEKICTSRTAPCAREAGLAPPEEQRRTIVPWIVTGASPGISILGTTWVAHSSFVEWAGSNTVQTAGGISYTWAHCAPLDPSWCYARKGSNFLDTMYIARNWGGTAVFSGSATAANTFGVMASQVVLGFFPFIIADGTCATHFGASSGSSVFLRSGFLYPGFNDC